jgi:FkbM family methyltransferase
MLTLPRVLRVAADAFEDVPTLFFKLRNRNLVSFNLCRALRKFAGSGRGRNVSTILDVGANEGQFAWMARYCWPRAQIYSFEPDERAVKKYLAVHGTDARISIRACALSVAEGAMKLRLAKVSAQNSFLVEPGIELEGILNVPVHRLDELVKTLPPGDTMLKLDVQGFEAQVLLGSVRLLPRINWILLEISLMDMYEGGSRVEDIWGFVRSQEFVYCAVLDQYRLPSTCVVAQMDVLFGRP